MLSKYNFYKEEESRIIIYNSISDNIQTINNEDFNNIIENEAQINSEQFDLLFNNDMLILDDLDDARKFQYRLNKFVFSQELRITVLVTTNCNFTCSYCYQDYEIQYIDDEFEHSFLLFIKRNIKNYKNLSISWFGGEPLIVSKRLLNLSIQISKICKEAGVSYMGNLTSNGFNLTEKLFFQLVNSGIKFFQVTIDGNKEDHDSLRKLKNGKGSYERIINNLKQISYNPSKAFFRIGIRNNVYRNNVHKSFFEEFKIHFENDRRFSYFQYPIKDWGGEKINAIKNELLSDDEILIDNTNSFMNRSFSERTCYAVRQQGFSITPDLKVYKCHHFTGKAVINQKGMSKVNFVGKIDLEGNLKQNEKTVSDWNSLVIPNECDECPYLVNCILDNCPLIALEKNEECKVREQSKIDTRFNKFIQMEKQ
ncbi:TPA: 4Fe-4S cluster-binding domain-containing protein [Listeria monocytogenes]|nr:4Fe-4S cluster-binding domain-containing protein [Listeria monocytogenes]EHX3998583.1 4Fe-4S cluster-binding domain-containing protein [Listeria monocytogenes]HAM1292306.1 4Fe-4S cluster-binding domain-containing protein [Listeria monocytogenes]HDT9952122.1 4Fe-4S cluster-binding domain-containing protein [Listeria monocytogenes]